MKYNVVINKAIATSCLDDSWDDFTRAVLAELSSTPGWSHAVITDSFETLPEGGLSLIGDFDFLNKFDAVMISYLSGVGVQQEVYENLPPDCIQAWLDDTKRDGAQQFLQLFELDR